MFTVFIKDDLPELTGDYPFTTVFTRKMVFNAHLHTTHAETGGHILDKNAKHID
jgi:hypothetical protein